MHEKGQTWNESATHNDAITGRLVRRITTTGDINEKAPYHTRTTFTDDGEFMIFSTLRDGQSALCRAHVATGDITQLIEPIPGDTKQVSAGTIAPISGWVLYWRKRTLMSVNIHTLEERTVVEDVGVLRCAGPRTPGGAYVDPDQVRQFPDQRKIQYIHEGIKARCRNGHELRVSPERLDKMRLSADGDLYLPGN